MRKQILAVAILGGLVVPGGAYADNTDALILNQANTVSGSSYLGLNKTDTTFGRVEGNGQNWLQFLTTKTDPGKNTLDLQGYQIDWSYSKSDGTSSGSGTMTFSNDPLWAAVPLGTAITVNEYQQAWYLINTPPAPGNPDGDAPAENGGGGMQRDGGIDGFGVLHGTPYSNDPSVEKLFNFATNATWNPDNQSGANWNINIWGGQQNGGNFQYFTYTGSVTKDGVTSQIGTEAGGLFVANNDNWQFTIKDAQGNIVEGPIGEAVSGWVAGGVSSSELVKLEAFATGTGATLQDYQTVGIANYADGSSSGYGGPTQWTAGTLQTQDLSPLRDWFNDIKPGDVNLDGVVNGLDIANVASHWLNSGVGLQAGDANGDGVVNGLDISLIASHWLQSGGVPGSSASSSATAVPEPASYVLCVIGTVMAMGWRAGRRRQ